MPKSARIALLAGPLALGLAGSLPAAPPPAAAPAQTPAYSADTDPLFQQPYVDIDEWRDSPVRHRYVHGGFRGTDTRFSFHFPPKGQYQGRFFQYVTPVPDSENTAQQQPAGGDNPIGFSVASGAYFVETNGGGQKATAGPAFSSDPTIGAYRANAAAARYSRTIAAKMYGGKRPFGYIYGGSGGAYRTIGSVENTRGVWDGAVPFVIGSPMAIPNGFTVRMNAMRVLWDKFPQIVDAMDVGGSGDPYAGLDEQEAAALREASRLGFPLPSWFGWKTMGVHAFTAVYPGIVAADPTYFDDFWSKPGYLGHDHPEQLKDDRLQFRTRIAGLLTEDQAQAKGIATGRIAGTARGTADLAWKAVVSDGSAAPVGLVLGGTPPPVQFLGGDLIVLSGAAKGQRLPLREIAGDAVLFGVPNYEVLAKLRPGDEVQVDNSNFLAAQTYHRHQVPGPEYKVYDQFRGPDGKPLYPQRKLLLGPLFSSATAGAVPSGRFGGKMIVVESLWDREAVPWQADWYRQRVEEHLGAAAGNHFRVWMTDRALHGGVEDPTRVVSYIPVLQQALRDLSAWVERGTPAPASTNYRIDDGQVLVPATAAERKGIQPVVVLRADGGAKATVAVGQPVRLTATAEVPPGTGRIVSAEWDFEGAGTFAAPAKRIGGARSRATYAASHVFTQPGTYFPVLRVASERRGNTAAPYAHVRNLGRVRVVVR